MQLLSKHALEFVIAAYIQTLLPAGAVCRRIAFVDVRDGLGVHWTQFRVAGGPPRNAEFGDVRCSACRRFPGLQGQLRMLDAHDETACGNYTLQMLTPPASERRRTAAASPPLRPRVKPQA